MVRGLREGGAPWLLQADDRAAILKAATPDLAARFATEAAALRLATAAGVPVPAVLGYDDGTRMLLQRLPGTSRIPCEPDGERLRALGAAAARLHTVSSEPTDALPVRDRPIADMDFAGIRREHGASRLLLDAEEIVVGARPAVEQAAFVHGDLWHGNTMWDGDVNRRSVTIMYAGARAASWTSSSTPPSPSSAARGKISSSRPMTSPRLVTGMITRWSSPSPGTRRGSCVRSTVS